MMHNGNAWDQRAKVSDNCTACQEVPLGNRRKGQACWRARNRRVLTTTAAADSCNVSRPPPPRSCQPNRAARAGVSDSLSPLSTVIDRAPLLHPNATQRQRSAASPPQATPS